MPSYLIARKKGFRQRRDMEYERLLGSMMLGRWLSRVNTARKLASRLRRRVRRLICKRDGPMQYLVLDELLETEFQYGTDLRIIVQHIQKPLVNLGLISPELELELFSSLPQMIMMSDMMLDQLRRFERTWQPKEACLGHKMEEFLTGFRIYNGYKAFDEQSLVKTRGEQILKSIEQHPEYQRVQMQFNDAVNAELKKQGRPSGGIYKIGSYLIKPTQRIARYRLFLERYQKLLPANHREKLPLLTTLDLFDAAVRSYQEKLNIEEQLQLYRHLGQLYEPIVKVNSSRRLLRTFKACTIQQEPVNVYFFTDMVMLTKQHRGSEQMTKVVELDPSSFVHVFRDGKYIEKVLIICGNCECCQLRFTDSQMLVSVSAWISQIIDHLVEREVQKKRINSQSTAKPPVKFTVVMAQNRVSHLYFLPNFKVTVEGAERRSLPGNDETYYIVRVALPRPYQLCQYLYCKYSTFERIEEFICKRYPEVILPRLKPQLIETDNFQLRKNRSMAIEYRIIALTTFLNVILRCYRVMANPIHIIDELRIQQSIWEFAVEDKDKPCRCDCCNYHVIGSGAFTDEYLKFRSHYLLKGPFLTRQAYCMRNYLYLRSIYLAQPISALNTYSKVLLYLHYKQQRVDEALLFQRKEKNQYRISVAMIHPEGQNVQLEVGRNTTAGEVIKMICCRMQHLVWFDYGLFIDYMETSRLIDSDEFILSVMASLETEISSGPKESNIVKQFKGKLSQLKLWGSKLLANKKPKLYCRKYLFLHRDLQRLSYYENPVRLRWVVEQAFHMVHADKIRLEEDEMVEMISCFLFLTDGNNASTMSRTCFPFLQVGKIASTVFLDRMHSSQRIVQKVVNKVHLELTQRPTSMQLLTRVIELVESKAAWYTTFFHVSNYDTKSVNKEVMMGVNHAHFLMVEPGQAEPIGSWPILELKYKVTTFSLFLEVEEHNSVSNLLGTEVKRLDGPLLLNLDKLAKLYQLYNTLFLGGSSSDSTRRIAME